MIEIGPNLLKAIELTSVLGFFSFFSYGAYLLLRYKC